MCMSTGMRACGYARVHVLMCVSAYACIYNCMYVCVYYVCWFVGYACRRVGVNACMRALLMVCV